jgi:hypothetical protein
MPPITPLTDEIVRWVRGDLDTKLFEQWVYQQPFEEFRDLIELNYRDPVAVAEMQERLAPELPKRGCYCALMLHRQRFLIWSATMEPQFVAPFEKLRLRPPTDALWKCRHCATHWLVARDDDDWYFERVSREAAELIVRGDEWPGTFADFVPGERHERWLSEVAPSFREGRAASMVVEGTLFSWRR